MTPAVAGEAVDAHEPGAAYHVDSEAVFDDHAQEHRQAPAFQGIERGFQNLALKNDDD